MKENEKNKKETTKTLIRKEPIITAGREGTTSVSPLILVYKYAVGILPHISNCYYVFIYGSSENGITFSVTPLLQSMLFER